MTNLIQMQVETKGRRLQWVLFLFRSPFFALAISFCIRLAIILATKSYLQIEHTEIVRVATSLAQHGTFADAFGPHTGPTAHVSPIYPILLSGIFRVFGTGTAGEIAQEVFSSLIASLTYAGLPLLSAAAGFDPLLGGVAGILGGMLPVNYWSETKGSFEAALAGFMLMILCIATLRSWRLQNLSAASAVALGMICGIALLVSPSLAPVMVTSLVAGFVLFARTAAKQYNRFALIVIVCAVLCLTPWAIRNKIALGGTVWSRSGFGLELSISNNDVAAANWLDNIESGWFQSSHPYYSRVERERVRSMGELAYNRTKMKEAMHWIVTHPAHFTHLCLERVYYFWFPKMTRPIQRALMAVLACGGFAGVIRMLRSHSRFAWLFLITLTAYPPVYYLVESFARYRCPIDWMLVFLTVFAVWPAAGAQNLGPVSRVAKASSA